MLGDLLEDIGFTVVSAENGQQGLELLRAQRPAPYVIMLDLLMPVMNGWEFLEARRHEAALAAIPVIVVSAALDASAELPNVAGYVKKPVSLEAVLEIIERLQSGKSAPKQPVSAQPDPLATTTGRHADRAGPLRVLLIQESDEAARLTQTLLGHSRDLHFEVHRMTRPVDDASEPMAASADVILLDLDLSGQPALTVLGRTLRRSSGVPVVVLLPVAGALTRDEALRKGALDVLERDGQNPELLGRSLVHAVDRARLQAELERARELALHERERRRLAQIAQPRTSVAAEMLGHAPLREAFGQSFQRHVGEFIAICEQSIRDREHELESSKQRGALQRLADALAAVRVGPGDIVDIYQEALSRAWSAESSELGSAKREEARLMLIALLGFVLAAYRPYVSHDHPDGKRT
ncbi:MAG: response regulator [Archangiaceae bacterium]|nr:response regulator [Archangiaceae bacterium]